MESSVLPDSWTLNMKDESTPILAGLQQQIDNWRLVTYLQRRDDYGVELIIPRPTDGRIQHQSSRFFSVKFVIDSKVDHCTCHTKLLGRKPTT